MRLEQRTGEGASPMRRSSRRNGAMTGNGRKLRLGAVFSLFCGSAFICQILLGDGKNLHEFRTSTFSCMLNKGSFVSGFRRTRSPDYVWILPALFYNACLDLTAPRMDGKRLIGKIRRHLIVFTLRGIAANSCPQPEVRHVSDGSHQFL